MQVLMPAYERRSLPSAQLIGRTVRLVAGILLSELLTHAMTSSLAWAQPTGPAADGPASSLWASWLGPGRLVSVAVVLTGAALAGAFWRRSWGLVGDPKLQERCRVWCLTGVLLVLYGLLLNGQWVPGAGDDAYYLAAARTLINTGEFAANGVPIVIAPYGWPWLIAGALKITRSFALLNLLPLALSVCALVLWYPVLRRLVDPRMAFASVVVAAILFHWHRYALHFYSEALYFALLAAAVLLSQQIAEGRAWRVRLAALLAISAGLVLARFAGALSVPLLVAGLLGGRDRPAARQWVAAGLVCATLAVSFFAVRGMLARGARRYLEQTQRVATRKSGQTVQAETTNPLTRANAVATRKSGQAVQAADQMAGGHSGATSQTALAVRRRDGVPALGAAENGATMQTARTLLRDVDASESVYKRAVRAGPQEYLRRLAYSGVWASRLFWPPTELGKQSRLVLIASNIGGWLLILLLIACVVDATRHCSWLWLGMLAFCGAFVAVWPEPNGRYIAGAAPLLLLAAWLGVRALGRWLEGTTWCKPAVAAAAALVVSIPLCNIPIYAMEVSVNQSPDFTERVLAGEYAELAGMCRYLQARGLRDNELVVASDKGYGFAVCLANLLTDRTVLVWPNAGPPSEKMLKWARQEGAKYYICGSTNAPRRLWHVQLAPASRPTEPSFYRELYEIADGRAVRVYPQERWTMDCMVGMEGSP